jgi:RES domain
LTISAPPTDPAQLVDFPALVFDGDVPLFRIHSATHEPEWFCSDGKCRFDPPGTFAAVFGACYVSTEPLGAYIEKFGRFEHLIPQSVVDDLRLTELVLPAPLRVANLTDRTIAGRWHLDAEIWAGADNDGSSRWAQALFEASFGGICYPARHDVRGDLISVAVFGQPGYQPGQLIQRTRPNRIPHELIEWAAQEFAIDVIPGVGLL